MTKPSLIVLAAGSPLLAPPLFLVFTALALNWQREPWWVSILSAGFALRVCSAFFQRRRFKRWLREWDDMSAPIGGETTPAAKVKAGGKRLVLLALAVLVFLTMLKLDGSAPDGAVGFLVLLWLACAGYLLFAMLRAVYRRRTAAKPMKASKSEKPLPVSWALAVPSGSASRAYIEANLPEHAARLIGASKQRERIA
jgi:hypothetical protein